MAVGDFNGDGKADLAVANASSNNVSVLLGNGNGTFQAAVNYAAGTGPSSVAVGDFNGDGKADLAVANYEQQQRERAAGQWQRDLPGGGELRGGHWSLVGGGRGLQRGRQGRPGRGQRRQQQRERAAGQWQRDLPGGGELRGGHWSSVGGGRGLQRGRQGRPGRGQLRQQQRERAAGQWQRDLPGGGELLRAGTSPQSVAVGDFNGDGKADLAVANQLLLRANNVSVLLGTWCRSRPLLHARGHAESFYAWPASDPDGDGFALGGHGPGDVLRRHDGAGRGHSGRRNGDAIRPACCRRAAGPCGRITGATRLYLASTSAWVAQTVNAQPANSFLAAVNYAAGTSPGSVAVGDFNGDGKADLAVANYDSNNVSVLLGNGNGTFQAAVNYAAGIWSSVGGGRGLQRGRQGRPGRGQLAQRQRERAAGQRQRDLPGGGELRGGHAVLSRWRSGTSTGTARPTWPWPTLPSNSGERAAGQRQRDLPDGGELRLRGHRFLISVAVGDFNGDGKADLAVANVYSNNVSVLLGNGNGTFQAAVNYGGGH